MFFSINSIAVHLIPLNPDNLNENNTINPIIDYYQNIEIFTEEQNKNNIEKNIKEKQLIEKVNKNMFLTNLTQDKYDIATELKKYDIFNNSETKYSHINEKQKKYNYECIIIFIVIFILCVLTYLFTKKVKKSKKGARDEYNVYFTNK